MMYTMHGMMGDATLLSRRLPTFAVLPSASVTHVTWESTVIITSHTSWKRSYRVLSNAASRLCMTSSMMCDL